MFENSEKLGISLIKKSQIIGVYYPALGSGEIKLLLLHTLASFFRNKEIRTDALYYRTTHAGSSVLCIAEGSSLSFLEYEPERSATEFECFSQSVFQEPSV